MFYFLEGFRHSIYRKRTGIKKPRYKRGF